MSVNCAAWPVIISGVLCRRRVDVANVRRLPPGQRFPHSRPEHDNQQVSGAMPVFAAVKSPPVAASRRVADQAFLFIFFIYLFKRLVQTRGPHHRGSQTNTKVQKHLHATNRRVCVCSYTQFVLKRMNTKASTGSITFGYRYT